MNAQRASSAEGGICLGLFVHGPNGDIEKRTVQSTSVTFGASATCDIRLIAPDISPLHARIDISERGGLRLTDCSESGTVVGELFVRGRQIDLPPTAVVRLGPYRLRFQVEVAAPAPPPLPAAIAPAVEAQTTAGTADVSVAIRRRIHRALLEQLDLVKLERSRMNDHLLRAKVSLALQKIVQQQRSELPQNTNCEMLIDELTHESIGLGPLDGFLADPAVTEIMVVDPLTIYVERGRRVVKTDARFTDEESVRAVLERIVAPLGRRIDESSPTLDARLPDGSRVNAVIRPLALRGTCITIRKFPATPLAMADLLGFGTLNQRMALFLERTVKVKKNILISGGTGSGKTTLLNVLSGSISAHERVVTIEDAAELRLNQPHVVALESRPANMEGNGQVTIRDLVKNAMRMRPDRIIVGECRGGEALDMLQAMNTGHSGSMTTTHANNPKEACKRIEMLALFAGADIPSRALREQIALSINVIVQQNHMDDGTRKITSVSEVIGLEDDGQIEVREIFGYRRTGTGDDGKVKGEFYATGFLPSFLGEFITHGFLDPTREEVL